MSDTPKYTYIIWIQDVDGVQSIYADSHRVVVKERVFQLYKGEELVAEFQSPRIVGWERRPYSPSTW